jgi:hypothetical protein
MMNGIIAWKCVGTLQNLCMRFVFLLFFVACSVRERRVEMYPTGPRYVD